MEQNNLDSRKERFRRVAERRTNRILDQIRILGNCSNKSAYSYNEEDVQKVFSTIERELRNVKAKFVYKRKTEFRL